MGIFGGLGTKLFGFLKRDNGSVRSANVSESSQTPTAYVATAETPQITQPTQETTTPTPSPETLTPAEREEAGALPLELKQQVNLEPLKGEPMVDETKLNPPGTSPEGQNIA